MDARVAGRRVVTDVKWLWTGKGRETVCVRKSGAREKGEMSRDERLGA